MVVNCTYFWANIDNVEKMCYNTINAARQTEPKGEGLSEYVNGGSPVREVNVMDYVTFSDLFRFVDTIIDVINIVVVLNVFFKVKKTKKKKKQ